MNYWSKYPTVAMITRERFGVQPPAIDEDDVRRALASPEVVAGLGRQLPLTDVAREAIAWAESMKEKMRTVN